MEVNTKATNFDGCTALIQSCKSRRSDFWMTTLIINNGGKDTIDTLTKTGWSALSLAVSNDNIDVALDLIEHGANINLRGGPEQKSYTPLMHAVENKNVVMVKLLLDNGANPNMYNDDGKKMFDT